MRQFFVNNPQAYQDLEARSRRACVTFRDQEMPPGCTPPRARVGFETVAGGQADLLVDKGITYQGSSMAVSDWLRHGRIRFGSFAELRRWIQTQLQPLYAAPAEVPAPVRPEVERPPASLRPEQVTDLDAVRAQAAAAHIAAPLEPAALFARLHEDVRGQDQALHPLASAVCLHLAKPAPPRPATLFAVGKTGVGKTHAAECLPSALADLGVQGWAYLRLDMSLYQERYRVSQLIGSPQGYVGYGEGAQLSDTLAANPHSIILFDEIDKAHPDVLTALMNLMDAGRLASAASHSGGREIDCRQAIFIFTSNLDADGVLQELDDCDGYDDVEKVNAVCRRRLLQVGMRPELIGRVGEFLVFRPLDEAARAEILTMAVLRTAQDYGLRLTRVEPSVIAALLNKLEGNGFGARPGARLVERELGPVFARLPAHAGAVQSLRLDGPPYVCRPTLN